MIRKIITSLTPLSVLLFSCGFAAQSSVSVPDEFEGDILVAKNLEINKKTPKDSLTPSLSSSLPISRDLLRKFQRTGQTYRYESSLAISKLWEEGQIKQATFEIYRVDTTTGKESKRKRANIYCLGSAVPDKEETQKQVRSLYGSTVTNPYYYKGLRELYSYTPQEHALLLKVCSSIVK